MLSYLLFAVKFFCICLFAGLIESEELRQEKTNAKGGGGKALAKFSKLAILLAELS